MTALVLLFGCAPKPEERAVEQKVEAIDEPLNIEFAAKMDEEIAKNPPQFTDRFQKAKEWPASIKRTILEHKIQLGMTTDQVTVAAGTPTRVNRSVSVLGTDEQWVYDYYGMYMYFENDKLTSYQRNSSRN